MVRMDLAALAFGVALLIGMYYGSSLSEYGRCEVIAVPEKGE